MKKILKGSLMSLSALVIGFLALALPFHLFSELNENGMRIFFIAEILIYFFLGMLFLFSKQKKAEKRAKEKERIINRREKFNKAQEEYYSLAA